MVYIQTLSRGLLHFETRPEITIGSLQKKLEQNGVAPVQLQNLLCDGRHLNKDSTLKDCHLSENSVLSLVLDLDGGAKKRKKKTYTTPKKVKHKRKKVKLAILKLFSTEGDRIRALRRTCPAEKKKETQATFMAEHEDRYYCGHCYVTIPKTKGQEVTA